MKAAISLPGSTFERIDRAARKHGMTRSEVVRPHSGGRR
ncbi:ribbon-helix-helix protein, CopG family [Beutenbergia cavernae]|nr:ribbon-helix-helix protein, CopG family [Beutenbergia cavernae]